MLLSILHFACIVWVGNSPLHKCSGWHANRRSVLLSLVSHFVVLLLNLMSYSTFFSKYTKHRTNPSDMFSSVLMCLPNSTKVMKRHQWNSAMNSFICSKEVTDVLLMGSLTGSSQDREINSHGHWILFRCPNCLRVLQSFNFLVDITLNTIDYLWYIQAIFHCVFESYNLIQIMIHNSKINLTIHNSNCD